MRDDINFSDLPEGCIAAVISSTTPLDACSLAAVSKLFKSAADSNAVWERFLPSDYADIIARSSNGEDRATFNGLPKKDVFLHLVQHPLLIDSGTKSFQLERSSGKKCYTICARELSIIWGGSPQYWSWPIVNDSRFSEVAELTDVCWLSITGRTKMSILSQETRYGAYFVFKMRESSYGFSSPVEVGITTSEGETRTRNVHLDGADMEVDFDEEDMEDREMPPDIQQQEGDRELPNGREDGWMEVEIGEFFTRTDNDDGDVEMWVALKTGNWKRGLVVEGIEIRPKVGV